MVCCKNSIDLDIDGLPDHLKIEVERSVDTEGAREAPAQGEKEGVYTDYEDEVEEGIAIDLPQITAALNMTKFKEMARDFLEVHETHLSLQRLRRNQAVAAKDLDERERMLMEAGGSQAEMHSSSFCKAAQ